MNSRLITPALLLVLVIALLLPGCNPTATNTNSSPQTYRFGAVIPLTGPGAALGGLIRRGIELGVEDVNNGKAADKQIGVVFEDSKTVPNEGLTAFRKLVDVDKVNTVLVGFSTVCNAVAPVAEESKILMIGMTTSLPGLTDGRNYVIRFFPNADMLAGTMADYASTRFSRVAVIYKFRQIRLQMKNWFRPHLHSVFVEGSPTSKLMANLIIYFSHDHVC
jgi:branched-chain amino acid transport system substrate-binding protein